MKKTYFLAAQFFLLISFLLQYSCFTMLCQLLLHSKMNQPCIYIYIYIYIYPPFFDFLPIQPQSIKQSSLCYTYTLLILCITQITNESLQGGNKAEKIQSSWSMASGCHPFSWLRGSTILCKNFFFFLRERENIYLTI